MPDAGFADRVERGTLLAAVSGDAVVGYVLFDLPGDRIRLVHLCTATEARGRGIARALVDAVAGAHPHQYALEAVCRRDWPANEMWPTLGFRPVAQRAGRGLLRHLLTIWRRDQEQPTLFTELVSTRLRVVLDHNVFQGPGDSRAPRARGARERIDAGRLGRRAHRALPHR